MTKSKQSPPKSSSKSGSSSKPKPPKIRAERFQMVIPLKDLEIDLRPDSPFFDHEPERRPDPGLVEDVKRRGLMHPPDMAQRIVEGKVRNFLIDGRCRYYAQLARNEHLVSIGEKPELSIEVNVRNDWSDLEVQEAVVAANAHRKSSSQRALISQACALATSIYREQKADSGRTNRKVMLARVAEVCGISGPQAERFLSFKKFAPEVQVAVLAGTLPWEKTDDLLGVDAPEQVAFLEKWLAPAPEPAEIETSTSANDAPETVSNDTGGQTKGGKSDSGPKPRSRAQWEKLSETFQSAGDSEAAKLGLLFVKWHLENLETEALFTAIGFEPPEPPVLEEVSTASAHERAVFDHRLFNELAKQPEPVSLGRLQQLLGAGTIDQIQGSVKRLIKATVVVSQGQARATRYGAVAGAQVAEPAAQAQPTPQAQTSTAPTSPEVPSSRTREGREVIDRKVLATVQELDSAKYEDIAVALPGWGETLVRCSLARLGEVGAIKAVGRGSNRVYRIAGTDDEGAEDSETEDQGAEASGELPVHSSSDLPDKETLPMFPEDPSEGYFESVTGE